MRLFQKVLNLVNIMLIYIKDERLEVARVSCVVTFWWNKWRNKSGGCISCEQTCTEDLKESIIITRHNNRGNLSQWWDLENNFRIKKITHPLPKRQWLVLDPKWKEQGQLPRQPKPDWVMQFSDHVTVSSSRDIA